MFDQDNELQVHPKFSVLDDDLMISIRERGIPFYFNEAKPYSADSPELMELPSLGTLLMTSAVDRVEYLVHGREGKEIRLHKRLPPGASVPTPPLPSRSAQGERRNSSRHTDPRTTGQTQYTRIASRVSTNDGPGLMAPGVQTAARESQRDSVI